MEAAVTALRRAWTTNKPLTAVSLAMAAVLAVAVVGLLADPTVITGAPAWLKPAKFAVSIAVYSFTFLWLLTHVRGHDRAVRLVSWVTAIAFAIEMALIAGATAAGTTSHFNVSSPLHVAVSAIMGSAIVAAWVANLGAGLLLLRQRFTDAAFAWSLRLGVAISAAGMGVAFLMTSPTPQQLAAAHAGSGLPVAGAHTVGAPDGGPGLPVVGWSTVGGDLRAPHFFGLHGLQVLPILGALLVRYAPAWLTARDRVALVITAGLAYLSFVGLTTAQALRGQPLTRPDALTLAGLATIAAVTLATTASVVLRARRVWRTPQLMPV
jgi:hypothetical protein